MTQIISELSHKILDSGFLAINNERVMAVGGQSRRDQVVLTRTLMFVRPFAFRMLTVAWLFAIATQIIAQSRAAEESSTPPNVVVILADDLGYGDLGCYGATKLNTPNIDRLAKEGRRFTDAHSASAVCTPSRFALLTGAYPFRQGLSRPVFLRTGLVFDPDTLTLADVMKNAGYATACIGKWHLGFGEKTPDWNGELKPGPLEVGFDYYFGVPIVNSHPPFVYVRDHQVVGRVADDPFVYGKKANTQLFQEKMGVNQIGGADEAHALYRDEAVGTKLAEEAVNWIETKRDKPFFLYLATTNIHHPFTPAPRFQGTSECGRYGDFVHELDWIVGEVTGALEANGLADSTLVIFTSDNGGMINLGGQAAVRSGHHLNGDLLGFKFDAWEGGHRVPFIARWPGKIQAETESSQLICNVDLLATMAALTNQHLTADDGPDSFNVLPAMTSNPEKPIRDHLVQGAFKPQHLAFRSGDWVFIGAKGGGGFTGNKPGTHTLGGPAALKFSNQVNSDVVNGKLRKDAPLNQLYNLRTDPSQQTNVVGEHPEQAAQLKAQLQRIKNEKRSRPQPISHSSSEERLPNMVVIFADDLGYGDLSCYRTKGPDTPHLDKLAADGVRCTDFFVPANVCSPSRAALLTGRYPLRCGVPVARNERLPMYREYGFPSDELTIPELLKPAGYRSLMVGKWHLGMEVPGSHPLDAGFDEHLGIPSNYEPSRGKNYNTLYRGRKVLERNVACEELTTRYTDEVVSFIERNTNTPFFIYVSHHIVHNPLKPSAEFVGKSEQGVYGDFVLELDHSTGRIMKALRDAGIEDDTLVVFTSDNGPTGRGSAGPMSGGKFCTMEGGHRVPGIFAWPKHFQAGVVSDVTMTSMDLLPTFCQLAKVDLPTDRVIDGKNIAAILSGESSETPHKSIYYYNGANLQAVRQGDWKLHLPRTTKDQPFWSRKPGKGKGFVNLEEPRLFNLAADLAEKNDLAAKHPEVVKKLEAQAAVIRAELGDVGVKGTDQHAISLENPQERFRPKQ